MATILDFKPRASNEAGTGEAVPLRPDAPADIIIFPGIRYERMESEPAGSARRDLAHRLSKPAPALLQG